MSDITLRVIGHVRNGRNDPSDRDWGELISMIELLPEYAAGLQGLEQFSHVNVVTYLDRDPDREAPVMVRRPRGRDDMPRLGVFAQRGRMRPNPIGVTTVAIVAVEPLSLVVRGLDALEGTPVLDLKPYVPEFDRPESSRGPEWMTTLMKGYFG